MTFVVREVTIHRSSTVFVSAKRPKVAKGHKLAEKFPAGEILRDLCKKKWKLGDVIGQGGFGLIYLGKLKNVYIVILRELWMKII